MDFKVGNIVKGKKGNGYGITNDEMYKGEVIWANNSEMKVRILDHKHSYRVGESYPVDNDNKQFSLVDGSMNLTDEMGFIVTVL